MSGNEMRTFVLCFNFLVGDYVSFENEVWKYYLLLRRLMEYTSCKSFPKQHLTLFRNLIKQYNCLYVKLFVPLKPKMHLIVHYPRILTESGPMPYLSMMRNEGKHKEIKESDSATKSRKHVTHTLSLKQTLKTCHRFVSEEGLQNKIEMGRSTVQNNL